MIETLSLPVRRFAALGLLGIFLFLFWGIFVDPVFDFWDKTGSDNVRSARLMDAYHRSIDGQSHWTDMLQQMQQGSYANVFTNEPSPDLASAKLQETTKHLTEEGGGKVLSIQVLPTIQKKDIQQLGVAVSFSVPVERLAGVLQKYDEARPYLFLDNLTVAAPENDPNSGAKPVTLMVNGTLSSYMNPAVP
jgi:general secretion pathway protein M